ncbi:hypothetical protein [Pseudomonas sediminis]|uniref:hypothetical protein n=1 Tax=Pseudomonas sediminis TaxID=1691904 RepID=UPI0031CC958A
MEPLRHHRFGPTPEDSNSPLLADSSPLPALPRWHICRYLVGDKLFQVSNNPELFN